MIPSVLAISNTGSMILKAGRHTDADTCSDLIQPTVSSQQAYLAMLRQLLGVKGISLLGPFPQL